MRNGEFKAGELIPGTRYRVLGLLGVGGMGTVYEVEHIELGKRFVLKALLSDLARREDLVARLRNEQRALGRLEHPSIVAVTDAGMTSFDVPYFVMERLDGETLGARLKRLGCLSVDEGLSVAAGVLDGLAAAHEIGVVHRDIKPQNIFLATGLRPKILDFGVAKVADTSGAITARGVAVGTPRYMSPEQASGEQVDGRSDIYAVGLVLFESLSGRGPFDDARDANELLLAHLSRQAPRLLGRVAGMSPELDELIAIMLAKDPARRPEHARAAAARLRSVQARLAAEPSAFSQRATVRLDHGPPAPQPTTHADGVAARRVQSLRDDVTTDAPTLARIDAARGANDTLIDTPFDQRPQLGSDTSAGTSGFVTLAEPGGGASTRTEILPALGAPFPSDVFPGDAFPGDVPTHTRVPITPTDGSRTLDPVPLPEPPRVSAGRVQRLAPWFFAAAALVLVVVVGRAVRPRAADRSLPPAASGEAAQLASKPVPVAAAAPTPVAAAPADAPRAEAVGSAGAPVTPSATPVPVPPATASPATASPATASSASTVLLAAARSTQHPKKTEKMARPPKIPAGLPGSGL